MNCPGMEEVMAWIDGELPPDRMESVRAHLEQCTSCRRLSEHQELIEKTWRESYTPPSDFEFNRFEKQITGRLFRHRSWIRTALPVAAAFAAVLLGIRIFVIGTPPPTVLERLEESPAAPGTEAVQSDAYREVTTEILGDGTVFSASDDMEECPESAASEGSPDDVLLTGGRTPHTAGEVDTFSSLSAPGEGEVYADGEDGLIDLASTTQTTESEAAVGQTVSQQADDQRGCSDGDALGMIIPENGQESEIRDYSGINRFLQMDDLVSAEEEQESEEAVISGTAGAGGSGGFAFEEHAALNLPESNGAEEPACVDSGWEIACYHYDPEDSEGTVTGEVESVSCFSAGVAAGGAVSGEDTCPVVAPDETVYEINTMIALREDRRSRSNMDSTLQVLEQDIMLDWTEKSGPEEIFFPACISISFQIAPDGSVFGIEVTVPPDSFFFDFISEIESRVSSLTFEETAEDACVNVELDIVLY